MSEDDRWNWHSYDYGWRRVMLGDYGTVSPIDPGGEWFSLDGVMRAERFFREVFKRPKLAPWSKPSSPDAIRTDCRKIPATELTDAERDLIEPEISRMADEARANIAKAAARSKQAFADRHPRYRPAQEIPPPKGFERATLTPQELKDLNARLGYVDPAEPQAPA